MALVLRMDKYHNILIKIFKDFEIDTEYQSNFEKRKELNAGYRYELINVDIDDEKNADLLKEIVKNILMSVILYYDKFIENNNEIYKCEI